MILCVANMLDTALNTSHQHTGYPLNTKYNKYYQKSL